MVLFKYLIGILPHTYYFYLRKHLKYSLSWELEMSYLFKAPWLLQENQVLLLGLTQTAGILSHSFGLCWFLLKCTCLSIDRYKHTSRQAQTQIHRDTHTHAIQHTKINV